MTKIPKSNTANLALNHEFSDDPNVANPEIEERDVNDVPEIEIDEDEPMVEYEIR